MHFNLDSPENKISIASISRYDVESVEVADLVNLMQQEEEKIENEYLSDFDLQAAFDSRYQFAQSIEDWRHFFDLHDEITEKPSSGKP